MLQSDFFLLFLFFYNTGCHMMNKKSPKIHQKYIWKTIYFYQINVSIVDKITVNGQAVNHGRTSSIFQLRVLMLSESVI